MRETAYCIIVLSGPRISRAGMGWTGAGGGGVGECRGYGRCSYISLVLLLVGAEVVFVLEVVPLLDLGLELPRER